MVAVPSVRGGNDRTPHDAQNTGESQETKRCQTKVFLDEAAIA
jgi:hypothetical protein